jgi:hypothetical protein
MSLVDIKGKPVRMQGPRPIGDRRDHARREALVRRIAAEFDDMPGLALTVQQASRFLGVDYGACTRVLDALRRDGLLRCTAQKLYVRADQFGRKVN